MILIYMAQAKASKLQKFAFSQCLSKFRVKANFGGLRAPR